MGSSASPCTCRTWTASTTSRGHEDRPALCVTATFTCRTNARCRPTTSSMPTLRHSSRTSRTTRESVGTSAEPISSSPAYDMVLKASHAFNLLDCAPRDFRKRTPALPSAGPRHSRARWPSATTAAGKKKVFLSASTEKAAVADAAGRAAAARRGRHRGAPAESASWAFPRLRGRACASRIGSRAAQPRQGDSLRHPETPRGARRGRGAHPARPQYRAARAPARYRFRRRGQPYPGRARLREELRGGRHGARASRDRQGRVARLARHPGGRVRRRPPSRRRRRRACGTCRSRDACAGPIWMSSSFAPCTGRCCSSERR